jgi:hypothetical protein
MVCGQLHAPVALPWGRNAQCPLRRRLCGPQKRYGGFAEERILLLLQETNPNFSSPEPSQYPDYANPAPGICLKILFKFSFVCLVVLYLATLSVAGIV